VVTSADRREVNHLAKRALAVVFLVVITALAALSSAPNASAHICVHVADGVGVGGRCKGEVCPQDRETHVHENLEDFSGCGDPGDLPP
jgi:hypothetical protein